MCAGKTVVLALQGVRWARAGRAVYVVCYTPHDRAPNVMLRQQLELALRENPPPAPLRPGPVTPVFLATETDAKAFAASLAGTSACVIIDEATFGERG